VLLYVITGVVVVAVIAFIVLFIYGWTISGEGRDE